MGIRRGIIQSRGLGDIVIALPIARYYFEQGDEIVWPICREFITSFEKSVPWVQWRAVDVDQQGRFFLDRPLEILAEEGCDPEENLYLYQYLSQRPDLTDPECFAMLKFDQYKYWVSGVPFRNKWRLADCITRDLGREEALYQQLVKNPENYTVVHLRGSNFEARMDVRQLDPETEVIDVDQYQTDSIFDWITVISRARRVVFIDSVMANLTDQMCIQGPELVWIRRSAWDLTPVLGSQWNILPTDLSTEDPKRVNPRELAAAMRQRNGSMGSVQSHAPFSAGGTIPKNFMHAVQQPNVGKSSSAAPDSGALDLYSRLGVNV